MTSTKLASRCCFQQPQPTERTTRTTRLTHAACWHRYSAPDPLGNENSKAKRRRRSSVVGASVLAGGSAYPTVTAIGPAVLEPHFSGPYVYERGTFGVRAHRKAKL